MSGTIGCAKLLFDDDVRSALESGRIDDAIRIVRAYLPSDEGGGESIDEDGWRPDAILHST